MLLGQLSLWKKKKKSKKTQIEDSKLKKGDNYFVSLPCQHLVMAAQNGRETAEVKNTHDAFYTSRGLVW